MDTTTINIVLWLLDVVRNIKGVYVAGCIIFCIALTVFFISADFAYSAEEKTKRKDTFLPILKRGAIVLAVLTALIVVLPSRDTGYAMLAVYAGGEITESELGKKAYEAIDRALDGYLAEQPKK